MPLYTPLPPSFRRRINDVKKTVINEISFFIDHAYSGSIKTSQSIFVSGFWRSGTTWLQQLLTSPLKAKSVFEPFYPEVLRNHNISVYRHLPNQSPCFLHTYMPFYEHDLSTDPEMKIFLKKIVTSNIKSAWLRRGRKKISESFRRRTIVKMVRGQLCLNAIHKNFHCAVVHIYRDPRSILASVKRGNWWKNWLDSLSLREQLLEQPDGRDSFFGGWKEDILRYDKQSPEERVVAYWALTERYVLHSRKQYGTPVIFVRYEDLYPRGKQAIFNIMGQTRLPYDKKREIDLKRPSSTSRHKRELLTFEQRKNSWKKELKPQTCRSVESMAVHFGLEDRLTE